MIRRQLFPQEGPPAYQGINMWRGVSRWKPFLSGATMVQAGWLDVGKMVIYPLSTETDDQGRALINWVAEIRSPRNVMQDWNLAGDVDDILPTFANWTFPWLDVAAMIRNPKSCSNTRWSIAIRFPIGAPAASRWSATPRIRCIRAGETVPARRSSTRARSPAACGHSRTLPPALKAYQAERLSVANGVVPAEPHGSARRHPAIGARAQRRQTLCQHR